MYISNRQIDIVVKVLLENENRLSDGYKFYYMSDKEGNNLFGDAVTYNAITKENTLKDIATEIIQKLNEVIYSDE